MPFLQNAIDHNRKQTYQATSSPPGASGTKIPFSSHPEEIRPLKENVNETERKEVKVRHRVCCMCADSSPENYFDIQGCHGGKRIRKELRGI